MRLSDAPIGFQAYTQLSSRVLAVVCRRVDGWCVYVDAVPGKNHDIEWQEVARCGDKQELKVATAIVENLFYPGFDTSGIPYAY